MTAVNLLNPVDDVQVVFVLITEPRDDCSEEEQHILSHSPDSNMTLDQICRPGLDWSPPVQWNRSGWDLFVVVTSEEL